MFFLNQMLLVVAGIVKFESKKEVYKTPNSLLF
jgi:hypothetical protein